jgi:hypothetical protein
MKRKTTLTKRKKTRQSFKQHDEMTGLIIRRHACIAQKVRQLPCANNLSDFKIN